MTSNPTSKKRIYFHPKRFFLDNVPKQADGTCYVLNAEYAELWEAYGVQEQEIERLRPMAESWQSYVASQERKSAIGLTDETSPNPFDYAAIMGDPGNRRISMSFEKQEHYDAALVLLDMADSPMEP